MVQGVPEANPNGWYEHKDNKHLPEMNWDLYIMK